MSVLPYLNTRCAGLALLASFYTLPLSAWAESEAEAASPIDTANGKTAPAPASNTATALPAVTVTAQPATEDSQSYVANRSSAASKTDTPLLETPQSISVVTNAQMEAQNVSTMAEALRYTPGVQSETFGFEPRTTFIKMRGFDVTENGLYRDGLKLINPGFSIGYSLEPYGAERVEVPRGPASVLYGQASPGGMVNYVSKRPTFDPFREIKFEAGSFGRLQGELDLSGAVDTEKTLAYRVTGLVRGSDTQVDFVPDDRVYVAPALTWKPSDATTLTLLTHYQKDRTKPSQRLPAAGTLYANPNGNIPINRFTGEPDVDGYVREEFAVGYLLEHRLNDWLTLRQNTRYYDNQVDDRTIYPTYLMADQRTVGRALYESFGKVRGFNLDNQAQFHFATGMLEHTLLAGLDFQHVDSSSLQTWGAAPSLDLFNPVYGAAVAAAPVFKNDVMRQSQIGLYLQDQIKLAEHWRITLGGRYDRAESETKSRLSNTTASQSNNETTGRAALSYVADNGLVPYFSYAQSFLPTMGVDGSGKPFQPETGEQYEFGIKYQPKNSKSSVTLAYFDLTRQNYLTTDPTTYLNVQRGEAHSKGVELEGIAGFDNGLSLTAGYTYTNARLTKSPNPVEVGERLEYAPEHKATLWADYTVPTGPAKGWGIGGGTRYLGRSVGNSFLAKNDIEIPGVVLFDASVHYTWKQLQFAVNLQNAFDKEYVATAFTSGGEFTTFGPRRVVTGSVKYSF